MLLLVDGEREPEKTEDEGAGRRVRPLPGVLGPPCGGARGKGRASSPWLRGPGPPACSLGPACGGRPSPSPPLRSAGAGAPGGSGQAAAPGWAQASASASLFCTRATLPQPDRNTDSASLAAPAVPRPGPRGPAPLAKPTAPCPLEVPPLSPCLSLPALRWSRPCRLRPVPA